MIQNLQIEFMRLQLHGSDSSLTLLEEDDDDLKELIEITSHFTVTKQRDVSVGAYVAKLTVRLDTEPKQIAFAKAAVIDLRVKTVTTRYRLDSKADNVEAVSRFGSSDLTMIRNEKTAVI